jgi:hypothetical protein
VLAMMYPSVLASALLNDVGTPIAIISQLNNLPACTPSTLRWQPCDWPRMTRGQDCSLDLFLYDSFIHNSTPVYPGALSSLLG